LFFGEHWRWVLQLGLVLFLRLKFNDMTQFQTLIKNPILLQNLEEMKYVEATDIQKETIPLIKEGKDIFGIAQTGTGKTASFCLPLIDNILNSKSHLVPLVLTSS
jgi:superfamily II DNA/RNA helicase